MLKPYERIAAVGFLIVLLFASGCASARSERVLMVTMGAAGGADLMTTGYCLGAGTCREGNPILRPLEDQPFAFGVAKMGTTAYLMYWMHKLHHTHPKLAWIVGGASAGAWSIIAWRNTRFTQGVR